MTKIFLGKTKLLILILLFAFILRIIGLYPNFLQHPDEPGVISPAEKIAVNTILRLDPNPNVLPHPFKYASAIFYMHAFIQAVVLGGTYAFYKLTGYTFALSQTAFGQPSFEEFLANIGPIALSDILLWFHRLPSVIFGVATVFLVYKTSLLLFQKHSIALFAATALAVMPHHVRDSHYATVTVIQAFFFLLAFFLSVKVRQQTNIRNCVWAGLSAGFATSIKYFPLPFLPLFFFFFLVRKKIKPGHLLITTLATFTGFFIGMPYLFSHFREIVNSFKTFVIFYAPDQATTNLSFIERLVPSYLHSYHLQFLFTSGAGPVLTLLGVLGMFYGLRRWPIVTVSLLIIPIINLVFISLYLEAIYDTLIFPGLPFFAVFIGIGCYTLLNYFTKILAKKRVAACLISIVFLPPFIDSAKASFACIKTITEFEAHDWIVENIPEGTKLAFQPNMRLPSKDFEFIRSEPKENFLLAELQETGAEYVALHSGYTDRYPQWLDDNLFLSKYIKDNEFTHLALGEFAKNAQLIKSFVRPEMCVNSRIYIYKVPPKITPAQSPVAKFNFDTENSNNKWQLGRNRTPSGATIETITTENENVIKYKYDPAVFLSEIPLGKMALPPSFYGTPFQSPFIPITPGKKYSAIVTIKRISKLLVQIPDGFIRLDFYSKGTNFTYKDNGKELILTRLSQRLKLNSNGWEKLTITVYAPKSTQFATISFQTSLNTQKSEYLIKEAVLLED